MKFDNIGDCVGKVISENPYVKILNKPRYDEDEIVPGFVIGRWTALAQVNGTLAFVELKVTEQR